MTDLRSSPILPRHRRRDRYFNRVKHYNHIIIVYIIIDIIKYFFTRLPGTPHDIII